MLMIQSHKNLLEQWRRTAHNVVRRQQHPVANAIAIVQDAPVTQARSFGHARRPRRELDIHDIIWMQPLALKRIVLATIFEYALIPL
jgi:hypothetical protein